MTENGSAYKSKLFAETLQESVVRHVRTRPFRPQANGKAERFIQTSLRRMGLRDAIPILSRAGRLHWTVADAHNLARPPGIGDISPGKG